MILRQAALYLLAQVEEPNATRPSDRDGEPGSGDLCQCGSQCAGKEPAMEENAKSLIRRLSALKDSTAAASAPGNQWP